MPRRAQLFYIASEVYEMEHPMKRAGLLAARKGGA